MLNLLKVKHTSEFSNRYFNEHPHKYNLYGLSKMLSDYGIENVGTKITDKENDLANIDLPFVAHTGSNFVVVYGLTDLSPPLSTGEGELEGVIHYLWNGKKISLPISKFIQSWSGIILLAEASPNSIEPDYKEHRKKELLNTTQKTLLFLSGFLILGLAYINQIFSDSVTPLFGYSTTQLFCYSVILLLNLAGAFISYLLVLKQMHIHSQYADKICSLFSKSDCNNVLESDAAKLWGVFGWSEIGLGYFSANVLLLLFLPQTVYLLALLNILTLPYTIWSIWYQKTKARQWCPLCLIVQILLWSIFILNFIFGYIRIPDNFQLSTFNFQLLFVGCVYAFLIFSFNLLVLTLSRGIGIENIKQEINSLKANEDVFRTLLTQQPFYEVSNDDSQVLFGNPDADLRITIFTNPFCNPCARMHKRVEKLLKDSNRNICIQYIFSSFTPELEFANKYLIAAYIEKKQSEFERIISDWFEKGKPLKEAFFDGLHLDMMNPEIETEFKKHEAWKEKTQLRATPTVLVNGYKLSDNYKIEDMRNFV